MITSIRILTEINLDDDLAVIKELGRIFGSKKMMNDVQLVSSRDIMGITLLTKREYFNKDIEDCDLETSYPTELSPWLYLDSAKKVETLYDDIVFSFDKNGKITKDDSKAVFSAVNGLLSEKDTQSFKYDILDLSEPVYIDKVKNGQCTVLQTPIKVIVYKCGRKTYQLFKTKDTNGVKFGFSVLPGILNMNINRFVAIFLLFNLKYFIRENKARKKGEIA